MLERNEVGKWIPLMDYAMRRGVSLSTLRRRIKSNRIEFKIEDGRYLVHDSSELETPPRDQVATLVSESSAVPRIVQLERDLREAQEEIAELKMLIAIYEERLPSQRIDN